VAALVSTTPPRDRLSWDDVLGRSRCGGPSMIATTCVSCQSMCPNSCVALRRSQMRIADGWAESALISCARDASDTLVIRPVEADRGRATAIAVATSRGRNAERLLGAVSTFPQAPRTALLARFTANTDSQTSSPI